MPTYTYHCENCSHEFDRRQNFSDASLKKCPECRKHALRKVYKPARIVFKGSGFYATDNKPSSRAGTSNSNGSAEKSENKTKASKDGESKKEKKTEGTKNKSDKSD